MLPDHTPRRRRPVTSYAVLAGLLFAVGGCGGGVARPATDGSAGASGAVTVFAAASLTESFTRIGEAFEAEHPGTAVTFNFGASSTLARQINAGAPADVFAAASPTTMAIVADAGNVPGEPTVFVRNRLQIAVPAGNPAGVTGLADFAREGLTIALCAEEVPCGAAATTAFDAAGVTPSPDTLEQDVKATLTKVELGEVDAALVYRTDVLAAGDRVEGIDFVEAARAVNDYLVAVCAGAPNAPAARSFVDYVLSPGGRAVFAAAGFDEP